MNKLLKLAKGTHSFYRLVQDMNRTNEVFGVAAELDDPEQAKALAEHFGKTPRGAAALEERLRVGRIDLQALLALPEGTLGHAYAAHMTALGLDPNFFPEYDIVDDMTYMKMHLYETHDLWHVVTGFKTDVAGELGLQAFYAAQFPQGPLPPILIAAGMLNTVFKSRGDNESRLDAIARGWFLGKQADTLFGVHWGEMWERPIAEIRAELGLAMPETLKVAAGQ